MKSLLAILVLLLVAPSVYGQSAQIGGSRYHPDSLSNPYGAGSRYKVDGLMNPYSKYGSRYSNYSWRNPYATKPPVVYSGSRYLGELRVGSSLRFYSRPARIYVR